MSLTVKITVNPNVVYAYTEGEFDLEDGKRTFLEIVDAVIACQCEKLLFDGRGITGNPETVERFYYGEFVAGAFRRPVDEGSLGRRPRVAYVLCPPVLDSERLGETVAVNRGMDIKAFDDLSKGSEWLGVTVDELNVLRDSKA